MNELKTKYDSNFCFFFFFSFVFRMVGFGFMDNLVSLVEGSFPFSKTLQSAFREHILMPIVQPPAGNDSSRSIY